MTKVIQGKIMRGKIIPTQALPILGKNINVKIFVLSGPINTKSYFGKGKNIFPDGLAYQKKIRKEWR